VKFKITYNQREACQPATTSIGPGTCDGFYITDNPSNTLSDVNYFVMGGGTRKFTGFNPGTQTFAFQQYSSARLTRTGLASYEMTSPDGSRKIFSQSDGAIGTSRKVFLTQMLDPFGNALTLTYDVNLRLVGITDAIGQVTALAYGNMNDIYKITRATDPFGRFADFAYDSLGRLTNITDVIGLNLYLSSRAVRLHQFVHHAHAPTVHCRARRRPHATTRSLETAYADGSRPRRYNQSGKSRHRNQRSAGNRSGRDEHLQCVSSGPKHLLLEPHRLRDGLR
jgi:YD repeat-containing protein